jgi:hypothetical protein
MAYIKRLTIGFNLYAKMYVMKSLLIIALALGLSTGASAQKVIRGGGFHRVAPRVSIGVGIPFYPGYYNPAFGPWYGYPFYDGFAYRRPSRLDMQVQDIRNVYQAKIEAARSNKSVPRATRRQNIKELKVEREQAVADARQAYYAPHPRSSEHNYHN